VGILTYLVYPIRSVVKNRMRSIYAMTGVILAISFFTGSFIAIDSSSSAMLRAGLSNIHDDFECTASPPFGYNISDFQHGAAALESVPNVIEAAPIITNDQWGVNKPNSTVDYHANDMSYATGSVVFVERNSTEYLHRYGIIGSVPERGTVAISKAMSESLGIVLGGEINITRSYWSSDFVNGTYVSNTTYLNLTYRVSEIWTQDTVILTENGSETYHSDNIAFVGWYTDPVVFNLADADGFIAKTSQQPYFYSNLAVSYEVIIDRDKVISAGDIGGTLDRLKFIQNRLTYKGRPYGVSAINSFISDQIGFMSSEMEGKKVTFLALSLPVMMLGTYLSMVGIDMATHDRRREIGIIKARGGTKRQVLGEMIVESLILGSVAAVIGMLGGILVSRLLIGTTVSFLGAMPWYASLTDISIDAGTLMTAMFVGIDLMVISSYKPIKRLIGIETSEALRIFAPIDARKEYNPKWDYAGLALSVVCIFSAVATTERWFQGGDYSFLTMIMISIVAILGLALLPILPIILSMSVIRLLTRGPRKLYTKFAAVMKPWTKEVQPLVEVNIERNPKRSSMMCMVIALAVAFGLFVSVTMESTLAYEIDKVKFQIGGDIGGSGSWFYSDAEQTGALNLSRLNDLNSSTDISSKCWWYGMSGTYANNNLKLFDPDAYMETVKPADYWFDGTADAVLTEMKRNNTALVSESLAENNDILVGDTLPVILDFKRANMTDLRVDLSLEIVGIVKGLPGITEMNYYVYNGGYSSAGYPSAMYGDYSLYADRSVLSYIPDQMLVNCTSGITVGILAALSPTGDHAAVRSEVQDAFDDSGFRYAGIRDAVSEVEMTKNNPYYGALTQFMNTEYASAMAIMTVGVAMIIFVTVSERRQEIACIIARGSTSKQMTKMLMGESVTLMMLGLVIGTVVGLLTAYLFNYMWGALMGEIGHNIVLTFVSVSILLVAIGAMLLVSFLTTVRAGKIRLAEVLRIRGG